jgi:hypothetical protein
VLCQVKEVKYKNMHSLHQYAYEFKNWQNHSGGIENRTGVADEGRDSKGIHENT